MDDSPSERDVHVAMIQAFDQIRQQSETLTVHAEKLTDFVAKLDARLAGAMAVAGVVDENESERIRERQVSIAKELMTHWLDKSHQYVTIIIGGAFAAYFATLATTSQRLNDEELRISAALMMISLTAFVLWEVVNVTFVGYQSLKGNIEAMTKTPRWYVVGWVVALAVTLTTSLPAIALAIWAYAKEFRGVLNVFG